MKRKIILTTPITHTNGLSQGVIDLNYLYVNDDETFTVFTKQGNTVSMKINPIRQAFIEDIENELQQTFNPAPVPEAVVKEAPAKSKAAKKK